MQVYTVATKLSIGAGTLIGLNADMAASLVASGALTLASAELSSIMAPPQAIKGEPDAPNSTAAPALPLLDAKMTVAELLAIAVQENVLVAEGATKATIIEAIEAARSAADAAARANTE